MNPPTFCDCGHPLSYHRPRQISPGVFEPGEPCGWCPPHSHLRCACKGATTTGVQRNDTFNSWLESSPGVPRSREHNWLCAAAVSAENDWVREGDLVRLYDVGTGFTTAWRAVFVRDFKGEMRMRLVKAES